MGPFDDLEIGLPCPGCEHETPKNVGWLKHEPDSYECAGCGKKIALDHTEGGGIRKAIQDLENAWNDLGDAFGGLK